MKKLEPSQFWGVLILLALLGFGLGEQYVHRPSFIGPVEMNELPADAPAHSSNPSQSEPIGKNISPSRTSNNLPAGEPSNASSPLQSPQSMQSQNSPQVGSQDIQSSNSQSAVTGNDLKTRSSHTKPLPDPASIDINNASESELLKLPGVGHILAQNIISYRSQYGPITSIDQLSNIKGIGPKKLEEITPYIHF